MGLNQVSGDPLNEVSRDPVRVKYSEYQDPVRVVKEAGHLVLKPANRFFYSSVSPKISCINPNPFRILYSILFPWYSSLLFLFSLFIGTGIMRKSPHKQNKKEERIILKYFSSSYPDFPKGKVMESESPDFIISTGPKWKFGLELTHLTRSNTENKKHNIAQIDSLEKVICERAKIIFESKLNIPLYVQTYFKEGIKLSKLSIDKYAEMIASDIHKGFDKYDRKSILQFEINNPGADKILDYIMVSYFPGVKLAHWNNSGGYMLPELTRDLLQQTILSKEEKLPLYQKNLFDEYWLLIYSDTVRKSTAFNIANQIEKWNLTSEFARVFLFEVMDFRVYRVG